MRWNPAISSSKIEELRKARETWPEGFRYNWSIYEWQEAHKDDSYLMIRVGEGPCGLVYLGHFLSEPYTGEDWAGDPKKQRHYVDISVELSVDPDEPLISIEMLGKILPDVNWLHGHSGERLTEEQAKRLWSVIAIE